MCRGRCGHSTRHLLATLRCSSQVCGPLLRSSLCNSHVCQTHLLLESLQGAGGSKSPSSDRGRCAQRVPRCSVGHSLHPLIQKESSAKRRVPRHPDESHDDTLQEDEATHHPLQPHTSPFFGRSSSIEHAFTALNGSFS